MNRIGSGSVGTMSISRSLGVRILPKDGQRKKAPGIHEDVLIYRILLLWWR